jgi:hypothetical protein
MNRNLPCVIFPHASLSEGNLKRVLSLFDRVTLFRPWFLEGAALAEKYPSPMVQAFDPPERLKPREEFKSLLAEYRQWIRVNKGGGFPAFLAYAQDRSRDPRIYEIRGMIRNMGNPLEQDEKSRILQWHLTLHLADELEGDRESTESLLRGVERLGSPLQGAIEDEDMPGLLSDVPDMARETFFTEERLATVLDAWVSVHGEQIPGRGPLVTVNPQVMQFLKDGWEEFVLEGRVTGLPEFSFLSPDLSPLEMPDLLARRETALDGTGLREAVAGFCDDPDKGSPLLALPADEPEGKLGGLEWTFVYLLPHGEKSLPRKYRFMKGLSGKILGLVKDAGQHER